MPKAKTSTASETAGATGSLDAKRLWLLLTILLIAFSARTCAAVWWQSRTEQNAAHARANVGEPSFHFGDSGTYWHLARDIAQGKPYQYGSRQASVHRTPGYPLLLAPLFVVWENPSPLAASMINVLLGTVTVWLVFQLGRMLFDPRVGLVAAALCAVEPGAIGMSVFVLSEGPFCPLALAHLICWIAAVRAGRSDGGKTPLFFAALGGVFCGLAILVRPSWLLFVPFAAVFLLAFFPKRKQTSVQITAMLVAMSVVMLPWWIRNWNVTGHFVPTTLQTGASLYDGLHVDADGGSDMRFVREEMSAFLKTHLATADHRHADLLEQLDDGKVTFEMLDAYETREPAANFEYEFNRYLSGVAKDWATTHPGDVASLGGKKVWRLWSPFPSGAGMPEGRAGRVAGWIMCVTYAPLILLAICGVVRYRNRGVAVWLCVLPAIYFTALHTIFVASIRYRQPAMLPLLVLAAAFAVEVWRNSRRSTADSVELPAD